MTMNRSRNASSPSRSSSVSTAGFQSTYAMVVNTIVVALQASICLIVGMSPLVLALFTINDFGYWPVLLLAAAASTPAIAAIFAVFRDQPVLMTPHSATRIGIWNSRGSSRKDEHVHGENAGSALPDWIAAPYICPDTSVFIFGAFCRAYGRLFVRSMAVGLLIWGVEFCLLYDIFVVSKWEWGMALNMALGVCAAMVLQALLVSLILVVEYPKARFFAVVRNGILLSVRRIPVMLIMVVAIVGYAWALSMWMIPVLVFATGLVAYIVWATARWQATLLFERMAKESGDKRLMELYRSDNHATRTQSWFKGLSDYIS